MKYLKSFESKDQLAPDRVSDIEKDMTQMSQVIKLKVEIVDSLLNELNDFKSDSKSSNDQIDDSIANLQLVRKNLSDSLDKLDNVVKNMNDYNESGSKFLY